MTAFKALFSHFHHFTHVWVNTTWLFKGLPLSERIWAGGWREHWCGPTSVKCALLSSSSIFPSSSILLHVPPSVVVDPMYELELERWLPHFRHFDTRYVGHFAI